MSRAPYLQQHAYNPVDWYPWGEEAFRRAAEKDKPIFLSIGYATCHWCHVMAEESFEAEVTGSMELETHTLYAYYRHVKGGRSPETAPTYLPDE